MSGNLLDAMRIRDLPPFLQQELNELYTGARDYRVTRTMWIASLAVLAYDHLLTVDDEVRLLRRKGLTWTKVLFVANRYWPMISLIFLNIGMGIIGPPHFFCKFFNNWSGYSAAPIHLTIGLTLILRIYAMYNRNKLLLWGLLSLLFIEIVVETVIIGIMVADMALIDEPGLFPGCLATITTRHDWAYWIPTLVFETVLVSLAIAKLLQAAKMEANTPRVMAVLLRDSVAYFGGIFAFVITNFVIWVAARSSLITVAIGPGFAAYSILGCRMLLNIHKAVQPTYAGHASIFATTFPTNDRAAIIMQPMKPSPAGSSAESRSSDETRTLDIA